MGKIRNFTPDTVSVYLPNGEVKTFPSEGQIRVSQEIRPLPSLCLDFNVDDTAIPVVECDYGPAEGIPDDLAEDDFLLVSTICVESLLHYDNLRGKILVPDTGLNSVVRDAEGKILGVRRFIRY